MFHESQFFFLDMYVNFVVLSNNILIDSSIGFTPFYLTLTSKARLHFVQYFKSFSARIQDYSNFLKVPVNFLLKLFALLVHLIVLLQKILNFFIYVQRTTMILSPKKNCHYLRLSGCNN